MSFTRIFIAYHMQISDARGTGHEWYLKQHTVGELEQFNRIELSVMSAQKFRVVFANCKFTQ